MALSGKITRPRLPEVLSRARLFQALDRLCDHPLIWVTGPPGAGKTTLLASYLEHGAGAHLWYRIDRSDRDIGSFFHHLAAASGRRRAPPRFAPEYAAGLEVFSLNFFRALFVRRRGLLVLDNYQDLPTDAALHGLLAAIAEEIPAGRNIVVLSREPPSSAFARLRANRLLGLLGWEDLRLTEEETEAIVGLQEGRPPTEQRRAALHARAGGWVAGLILLLEQRGATEVGRMTDRGATTTQALFDYFAAEIVDRLDAPSRHLLMRTAWLPDVDAAAAKRLTGRSAHGLLHELNRRHFFVERLARRRSAYQYHPLFREFLLARAQQEFDADALRDLKRQAAAVLDAADRVEEATELLLEADEVEEAVRRIRLHGHTLIHQGRCATIERWLRRLPDELLSTDPALLQLFGLARLPYAPGEALGSLERAFAGHRAAGDRSGMLAACCAAVDAIQFEFADLNKLDPWIARFQELIDAGAPPALEPRVAYALFAALVAHQPDHPDIGRWERCVEEVTLRSPDPALSISAGYILAFYRMWTGRYTEAGLAVDNLRATAHVNAASPLIRLTAISTEAMYETLVGSPRRALPKVEEGVQLAHASGVHIWDHMLRGFGVAAALSLNERDRAAALLAHMQADLPRARPVDRAYYRFLDAWSELCRGDGGRTDADAAQKCATAHHATKPLGLTWGLYLTRLQYAESLRLRGAEDEALGEVAQVLEFARRARSHPLEISALLSLSDILATRGRDAESGEALARALRVASRQGVYNVLGWRPKRLMRHCLRALETGVEKEFVRSLIRHRDLTPDEPPVELEDWPWAVRVYTLGRFEAVVDGRPSDTTGGNRNKPMELLKVLIALGGRDVSLERLAETLWPEAEGDSARRAFDTTLHRLRRLLGGASVLRLESGGLSIDPRYVWIDCWALMRRLERLQEKLKSAAAEMTPASVEAVLSLYRGRFLRETDRPWAFRLREALHQQVRSVIVDAGKFWESAGRWEQAAACYGRGIEIDPVVEEFYQGRMRACHALGRPAEVAAAYHTCRKALAAVLQVEPCPETRVLLQPPPDGNSE
ncbi:MAG: BTAD domain-containing putative transcriptional regulator [Steroidobacteraceae bacterium]|nr:BTAD domain-containing putative transcriptional regulator [Steroidobacteraceae bacterium]